MQIENLPVAKIVPYDRNPRITAEAVPYVEESIKQFGFLVPIIVDKDNVIVAGHTRYQAALRLNYTELPCVRASDLTEQQIEAFRIADNKVSEYSQWHMPLLEEILGEIGSSVDMAKLGFLNESASEAMAAVAESMKAATTEIINPLEVKAFEHWDYLVFVFENDMDWIKACDLFGIKKVDMVYGDNKLRGMGRVVFGKRLFEGLEKLKNFENVTLPHTEYSLSEEPSE